MNPTLKYRCDECDDLYDDDYDARHCCEPSISEVYSCGHCGESFGSDDAAAENCCEDVDPDALPIVSKAELEAAGQMRLCV
jgi:hypothetical protein